MPSLSIIIPFVEQVEKLEATLVSVLENRPDHCEILVLHGGDYSDPYDLEGEIHFVENDPSGGPAEWLANVLPGIASPVTHLLSPGASVSSDWTVVQEEF